MSVTIEIISGAGIGRRLRLRRGQSLSIGSSEWSDWQVSDPSLDAIHFKVTCRQDGSVVVTDAGSRLGITVGQMRVAEALVEGQTAVRAGGTLFRVESLAKPRATGGGGAETASQADGPIPTSPLPYASAVLRDATVCEAALLAAAVTGQPWLYGYCRTLLQRGDPQANAAVYLAAVLHPPADVPFIVQWIDRVELGPRRFHLAATSGHPALIPSLLRAFHDEDAATACAAHLAFQIITGRVFDTDQPKPEEAPESEFDAFVAARPDPAAATHFWDQQQVVFTAAHRWRRGINISQLLSSEMLAKMDMEARTQIFFRHRASAQPITERDRLLARTISFPIRFPAVSGD